MDRRLVFLLVFFLFIYNLYKVHSFRIPSLLDLAVGEPFKGPVPPSLLEIVVPAPLVPVAAPTPPHVTMCVPQLLYSLNQRVFPIERSILNEKNGVLVTVDQNFQRAPPRPASLHLWSKPQK